MLMLVKRSISTTCGIRMFEHVNRCVCKITPKIARSNMCVN